MEKTLYEIANKIVEVAEEENKQLMELPGSSKQNLGIFHMPELAFAYECGKQIMKNAKNIFHNDNIPSWQREISLGNGGPSDLVFEFQDGYKIVIEFKMRDTIDAYLGDLSKLSKLEDSRTSKLFCAIVDVFQKDLDNDGRVSRINNDPRTEKLKIKSFYTKQTWYKSDVYALTGIWKVK